MITTMEWKLDSTTYILPLDSIDVDLLSVRRHRKNTDAAPIPIWSANKPTDEYYEFEVYAGTVEDDVLDCVENQTTQSCHICNVDVPTAYLKEHYSSETHKTFIQITENAMERSRKQISTETFILDKKSDSKFFCTSCVEVVSSKNKNRHDGSEKHVASVKYDEFIQEFATAFMDRDTFIKHFDQQKESKGSPNVEKVLKIETNQQIMQKELVHETATNAVENDLNKDIKFDNLLQSISSSMTNLTLEAHIGDIPGVTITFNTGYRVLVPTDNFHGLHRTPHGPVQCRLCRVLVDHEEQHLTDTAHMQYIQRGIQDQHCIRQLDSIWSHCVICNEFVENKQLHISGSEHMTLYNRALLLKPVNIRPTTPVCVKLSNSECKVCNVILSKSERHIHSISYEHRYNLFIFKKLKSLPHNNMQNCPESECKICKISIPRLKEDMKSHTNSEEHISRFNQMLKENGVTKTNAFQLYCGACRKTFLEIEFFQHIDTKRHKKSVLKFNHVHKFQQNKIVERGESSKTINGTGSEKFEDDDNDFVNDFTTTTFKNSNIVGMSLNQQNTNMQKAASTCAKPDSQSQIDKENVSRNEQHTQIMQKSPAGSGIYQPVCQASTSASFGVSQIQNTTTSSAQPNIQVQNKPIMTKNYIHWLNINKLTPLSDNNDQYHCGFCDLILYKAVMFDHCNNVFHKINVDKVESPIDGAEVKTEASREDTVTTEEIAKKELPEKGTVKTEMRVGAAIIELPQNGFHYCEVCRSSMPNTETDINTHFNSKRHLHKLEKCERKAKREERLYQRLNKQIDINYTEPPTPSTEVKDEIMSSKTPSTSQQRQNKLCKYCKTFIDEGTEFAHVNSELHKKNVIETVAHQKSKNVVLIGATVVNKEYEGSYNSKIINDVFNDEIGTPGTSSQPGIVQNTCKEANVIQAKPNRADTVTENNDNYIVIFDKIAHCQLCNHSVKNIDEHASARRHKYLESLISPNHIEWSNGKFLCNICSEIIKDQSIFIHTESAVHKNKYKRNTKKVDGSNSNTSDMIFCTICNDYILERLQIRKHYKIHAADITDISLNYLENLGGKIYRCQQCNGLFKKKWRALLHVLGEEHLNIFTTKVTSVENEASKGDLTIDSQMKITDNNTDINQKYPQEIEKTANDDDVSKFPEEFFCEICKDNILVPQIRKHFKETHAAITNLLLEEFKLYFEEKGRNKYRCVHCDFMFYGNWNSLEHILGKHHYNLLSQTKTTENASETSKGDLINLINNLEKRVKEQEDKNAARLRDMSCFDDTEKIHQNNNHSLVLKDRMIEKEARKGYDPFEDDISNIQQPITEGQTNTCIADDWWDLNDDFDDYIVFDDKAGKKANISELYTEVWNDMYMENVHIDATTDIPEDFDKTDNPKEFFCKVCRVRVPSSNVYIKIHVDGSKHMKLLAEEVPKVNFIQMAAALGEPSTHYNDPDIENVKNLYLIDKSERETLCRLCYIGIPNTVTHKRDHLNGRRHVTKMKDKMSINKVLRHNGGYKCNVCVKPIRNKDIELHMESFRHKRAMNDRRTDDFSKRFFGNITLNET